MKSLAAAWMGVLARRGFQALAVALIVGVLCFFMMIALPGDLAMRVAAGRYGYDLVGAEAAAAVTRELGLDRPMWEQLAQWLGDLLRLDLGVSLVSGEPVLSEIAHQLGATLALALVALLFGAVIGAPLGLMAGLKPGGWEDRLTLAAGVVLRATPPFLLALVLMIAVAVMAGALPVAGDAHAASVILPALTLGLGLAAGLARVARAAMRDVAQSPAYEFARSKGLTDAQALWRHGVRAAAVPMLAYLGVHAVFLIEGAVVVETLFAWPGIGHALVHAVFGRDIPMIQGAAICMAFLFVALNALVDGALLAVDPRQRGKGAP